MIDLSILTMIYTWNYITRLYKNFYLGSQNWLSDLTKNILDVKHIGLINATSLLKPKDYLINKDFKVNSNSNKIYFFLNINK